MTTPPLMCPGPDPAPDWREQGWCCRECAALSHLAWCPLHGTPNETFAGTDDRPVPFTLAPKAHAALEHAAGAPAAGAGPVMDCGCGYDDCSVCAGYGWACLRCGLAFFGTPPEHGLCLACHAADGGQ